MSPETSVLPTLDTTGYVSKISKIKNPAKGQRREKLTERVVSGAVPPTSGQVFIRDSELPGLALRITSKGAKSFIFEGRIKGRPRRHTFGRYPTMTVQAARARFIKLRDAINDGRDPVQEQHDLHHALTFRDLVDEYLADAESHERKSLPRLKERCQALHGWFNRRATDITENDVTRMHRKLGDERGKVLANRVVALVCAIYNHAINQKLFTGANPASGIERFEEHERERFLSQDEMVRVNKALADELNEYWRAYFPLTLMLGTRKSELLQARWEHVDLNARTLMLPMTKNGKSHLLPLPGPAVSILEGLPSRKSGGFIFPSNGRTGHLSDASGAWQRIRARAKVEDVTVHDLRRTLGSWLAGEGHSLLLIGKALHHRNSKSTQIYARLALEPLRQALEKNAQLMLGSGS